MLRLPSGRTVPIAADRAEIGRGITNTEEAAAIDLTGEPDKATVSRIHALITHAGGRFEIEDLRSANGTVLDGQKLIPGQRYPLQNGDMVEFGKVRCVFGRGSAVSRVTHVNRVTLDLPAPMACIASARPVTRPDAPPFDDRTVG